MRSLNMSDSLSCPELEKVVTRQEFEEMIRFPNDDISVEEVDDQDLEEVFALIWDGENRD